MICNFLAKTKIESCMRAVKFCPAAVVCRKVYPVYQKFSVRTPCAKKAKPFQSEFAFLIFAFVVTINCGRGAPTQAV